MTESLTYRTTCRACTGPLEPVLHLGELRLNAFPGTLPELAAVPRVPHTLTVCLRCGLCQLAHTIPPDWAYREYWYRSAVNESMVVELTTIVKEAAAQVNLSAQDYVLDIGANDGTLLAAYKAMPGYPPITVGVEPARNLKDDLARSADIVVTDYFPTRELDRLAGRMTIITAIAMAYDVEDPVGFFTSIKALLAPNGIAVIQFQDLEQQIRCCAFDNIVPEHLEYYTLSSLLPIVAAAGLQIRRVQATPINGGSLRVTLGHPSAHGSEASVNKQLRKEEAVGLSTTGIRQGDLLAFERFRRRVETTVRQVQGVVQQAQADGATLDWYGASTKSNVTMQVLGLGALQVRQCWDRNPDKHGRLTVTGIPIVSEDVGRVQPPDLLLGGIWQFRDVVLRREAEYLKQGGRILFPLPVVEMVEGRW